VSDLDALLARLERRLDALEAELAAAPPAADLGVLAEVHRALTGVPGVTAVGVREVQGGRAVLEVRVRVLSADGG